MAKNRVLRTLHTYVYWKYYPKMYKKYGLYVYNFFNVLLITG